MSTYRIVPYRTRGWEVQKKRDGFLGATVWEFSVTVATEAEAEQFINEALAYEARDRSDAALEAARRHQYAPRIYPTPGAK